MLVDLRNSALALAGCFLDLQAARENYLRARLVSIADSAPSDFIPIYKIAPYYPETAAGAEGSVIVQFTLV